MGYAVMFPGQGSQFVGMGADLFERRPDLLGDAADEVLGWSLRRVCLEGPEDRLTATEHAQPALFALAYALWAELEPHLGAPPVAAAGHSLGEYTALTAAGVFSYRDALALVAERGRAMADAAAVEPSGMAALIGADVATATEIVERRTGLGGRLAVANVNAPGQVVVAGGADDLAWLAEHGRELGVRRVVPLKVAGAFHSEFMAPAAARLEQALAGVDVAEPRFDVYSNVTARPHEPGRIREMLVRQVVSPVRFAETLTHMAEGGIGVFIHVGPGDVTAGLARRTVKGATVLTVSDLAGIEPIGEALSTMAASGGD